MVAARSAAEGADGRSLIPPSPEAPGTPTFVDGPPVRPTISAYAETPRSHAWEVLSAAHPCHGEDLARIRLADRPDPMWETVLSSLRFRDRRGPGAYGRWRELARQRLRALPPTLRALVPVGGYFPDFLTPVAAGGGWEERVELLRSTPRRRLRADMLTLEAESPQALPGWVRGLADGEREALDKVADDLDRYHRAAIAPPALWAAVQAQVDADRAVRIRHLTSGGVEGLLRGLRPVLRWEAPVLAADYPVPRELRLDGRGLLLIPSFFCWRHPVTFYDDGPRPVLVYPIQHTAPPDRPPPRSAG